MKLPDISGMERQRASSYIQSTLKQEQNALPEGHGIWYNLYRYPDLKRCYSSMPVRYKVDRLIQIFAPLPEDFRKAQLALASRLAKTCIVAVRVTGPIVNSSVYRNALDYRQARDKADQKQMHKEWLMHQPDYIQCKVATIQSRNYDTLDF